MQLIVCRLIVFVLTIVFIVEGCIMDKLDAIEYLNQSKYFFGTDNYEEALNYVNKGIDADKMNIEMHLFSL